MQILLINLKEAQDRLAFQHIQFAQLGLKFQRIDAIKGADVDEAFYQSVSTKGLRLVTRNEVACFLSHQKCWQFCVDNDQPVIILEDDIVLSADFTETVKASQSALTNAPSLINLEMSSTAKRIYETPLIKLGARAHLHKVQFAASGAGAYILTPATAAFFIQRAKETFNLVDLFMYSEKSVQLLQIMPAPAMQMLFLTDHKTETITQSYINQAGQKRPTSWESFRANPMTRIRRLKANIIALYLKYAAKDLANTLAVTPAPDIKERFERIKCDLKRGAH